jgi:DNA-binding response OmpR family regulator
VLDLALPEVSGLDPCRRLREDPSLRKWPIVTHTANHLSVDVARGSAAGFDAYLTKALDVPQFLAAADRLLGRLKQSSGGGSRRPGNGCCIHRTAETAGNAPPWREAATHGHASIGSIAAGAPSARSTRTTQSE